VAKEFKSGLHQIKDDSGDKRSTISC